MVNIIYRIKDNSRKNKLKLNCCRKKQPVNVDDKFINLKKSIESPQQAVTQQNQEQLLSGAKKSVVFSNLVQVFTS